MLADPASVVPVGMEVGGYDAQDRLLAYDGTTYTYTRNGELATATDAGGTTSFSYDVFGNLLEVTPPGGPEIEYVVDARNRRIGKKLDGTLVQGLLWQSQLAPIAELDGSGDIVSRFVHATRVNVPDYMTRAGSTYRILADHLGSPRLVVDTTTGAVVQRMDFDEWGIVLTDTNPGWTPFGFGGGLYDGATGLVRFGARDFDARAGRWTAKDPIGFAGGETGLLGYGGHEPVNRADPSGLSAGPLVCRLMGPLSGGATMQELELAGLVADGLIAAGIEGSNYSQQNLRSQLPTGVNVVLDAQEVRGGWSLVVVGKGLATAGGAGASGAVLGVLAAGGGGVLIGRGLDNLYQDLGGTPLSDYFYDWFLDDGFRLSPNDLPPPYGAPGCAGDPACP